MFFMEGADGAFASVVRHTTSFAFGTLSRAHHERNARLTAIPVCRTIPHLTSLQIQTHVVTPKSR
jgi:hypothetical protein